MQVMKVLAAWSDAIARGVMNEVTQNRLWQELSGYTSNKQWQVFPGTDFVAAVNLTSNS